MKKYKSGNDLRKALLEGAQKLEENVACTLGPKGNNVILHREQTKPLVTKDGVTVAKFVDLEDPFQNMAAQILKQASIGTVKEAGDGTTTSTILSYNIYKESMRYLHAGVSPHSIRRGLKEASEKVFEKIKDMKIPIRTQEDIKHVAAISANNDKEIGALISDAVDRIGRDGSIVVEEGRSTQTSLDFVEGFRVNCGYLAPQFINDEARSLCVYEEPYFLITDHRIIDTDQILPVLTHVANDKKPLVIVAQEVSGEALAACIYNAIQSKKNIMSSVKVAVVRPPKWGNLRYETMEDMAIATGARYISHHAGDKLEDVSLKDLGLARKVEIGPKMMTIIENSGDQEEIDQRIDALENRISLVDDEEGINITERIARLSAGTAVIRVGGLTEVDMVERKHRIEDALEAVSAAKDEGMLAGGGSSLLYIENLLNNDEFLSSFEGEKRFGAIILLESILAPFKRLAKNCDMSWEVLRNKLLEKNDPNLGVNFLTGEVVNMHEAGILDPAKVVRVSLENAISAAGTLLTTNSAIFEE